MKEKKLGRGLASLLGQFSDNKVPSASTTDSGYVNESLSQVGASRETVDITFIDRNPYQPRQEFDEEELDRLSESLQTHGLLQPLVVRKVKDRYQIIAGERRYRAAIRAGWTEIPVYCLDIEDREAFEVALTENLQRTDLNAIEKAYSFARYLDSYGGTHEELAKRLEVNRSTVSNLIRLRDLPQQLQDAVQKGTLSAGHARALLPLGQYGEQGQLDIAQKIQDEDWSVRATERYVNELLNNVVQDGWNVIGQDGKARPAMKQQSEQIQQLEQNFREYLGGMKVKLTQTNEKGKGKLTISFANHAEFERIYSLFGQNRRSA